MKIGTMKTSKYIKKEDVGNGKIVTINKLDQQDVSMENDPTEMKYVMYFNENVDGENKGMVLNWTNIQLCARALNTEETDEWIGKQIELYDDPNVTFGGKLTGGIRIRPAGKPLSQPAQASKTASQSTDGPPTPPVDAYENVY